MTGSTLDRRRFLLTLTAGALLGLQSPPLRAAGAFGKRRLLLIQLAGGNDGLNTLAPIESGFYRDLRPTLALEPGAALGVGNGFALHPELAPLMPAWHGGELALLPGVGYPNPNRSHFRSSDIWHTASRADTYLTRGWLSRCFPQLREGREAPIDAVVLDQEPAPCKGGDDRSLVLDRPESFLSRAGAVRPVTAPPRNEAMRQLGQVTRTLHAGEAYLSGLLGESEPERASFGGGPFGRQLSVAARLINAGADLPVFKIGLVGFDTHAGQLERHAQLLRRLALGLADLRASLTASGHWPSTLVLIYSEFGRRMRENGSAGTDHGAASLAMLLGGAVVGGLGSEYPSLSNLDAQGDLRHGVDFRRIYASILEEWFGLDSALLPDGPQPTLDLIRRDAGMIASRP